MRCCWAAVLCWNEAWLKFEGVERTKDGVGWTECWRGDDSGDPEEREDRSEDEEEWID